MQPEAAPAAESSTPDVQSPQAPVSVEPTAPNAEEAAQAAEDKEWQDATEEAIPGTKSNEEGEEDGEEGDPKAAEKTGAEGEEGEEGKGDGEDGAEDEAATPAATVRDARIAARESAKQVEEMSKDVRDKLFPNLPTTLLDADGDPITGLDDVMKLIDPRTGERFTEEAAGLWFLQQNEQFKNALSNVEREITEIAEVNIDLKDQADSINERYGAILKDMPELRDEIFEDFMATVEKDPATGIIKKAPVSMERFYDRALKPYLKANDMQTPAPTQTGPTPEEKAKAEAEAAAAAAAKKQQSRADRSDVYVPNNTPVDTEDDEWGNAAKEYYGSQNK